MDLAMTNGGDFVVGPDNDLLGRDGNEQLSDDIVFRLRTYIGDYDLRPALGTDLESYIGLPMTRELLRAGEREIARALTHDAFLIEDEFDVTGIPVSEDQAVFVIRVRRPDDEEIISVTVPFSWTEGFLNIL